MSEPPASCLETLPQHLWERAQKTPHEVALRERRYGIWQAITWSEYLQQVRHCCLGLIELGLQPEETVAIIGDNRPEWIITELAAQAAGAKAIGFYQDTAPNELATLFAQAGASFILAEDQEQVDKILEIRDSLSTNGDIRKIIYYDPKGLYRYDDDKLLFFPELLASGARYARQHPQAFADLLARGRGSDVAILSTTSGTAGVPKLAMLSHSNLLSMGRNLMQVDGLEAGDDFVSFLPLAWIGEQMMALSCSLQVGFVLNFPEEPETARRDIREIGPQVMFSPPRIWESLVSQVQVRIEDSTPLKRRLYEWGMAIGYAMADARFEKQPPSLGLRLAYLLADGLVFQPIKDQLGLRRLKRAYTGGAPLGPDGFRFFHALGVNLKQIYGQTETSGISVLHRDGDVKFQTVGRPLPDTEIRLDDAGEILVRSPAIMQGYYKNPEATAKVLADGWLRSGDAGAFDDDGHLIVIDRASDVMTLPDGTRFSPQFIENKLKFSPYVKEAVVFGGDHPFVTAIINIDFDNAGKWAEKNGLAYTTYTDLSQKREIYRLVLDQVRRANADLPPAARLRRFVLLHKELDADDAELTRTRKVRRRRVAERYQDVVQALAAGESHLEVKANIVYRDGRSATVDTQLRLLTVTEGS